MKIIESAAGIGKTSKILEIAGELSNKGISSIYLTNEQDRKSIRELADHLNVDMSHMQYEYVQDIKETIRRIVTTVNSYDYYFVDIVPSVGESVNENIRALLMIEEIYKINLFVTAQSNMKHNEGLMIYDFQIKSDNVLSDRRE